MEHVTLVRKESNRHEIACRICCRPGERSCATARRIERNMLALGMIDRNGMEIRRATVRVAA